jgi:hypothetical protein
MAPVWLDGKAITCTFFYESIYLLKYQAMVWNVCTITAVNKTGSATASTVSQ